MGCLRTVNAGRNSAALILVLSVFSLASLAQATLEATGPEVGAKSDPKPSGRIKIADPQGGNLINSGTYVYSFNNAISLEDMSAGTTQLIGAGLDDTASAVTSIGFEFWYDGVRYTQFSCNANGLCRLGSTAVGTTFDNSASGLNSTTNAPKIAPFFDDLCTGSNGNVRFKVVGSAPSRKLVVEWNNAKVTRDAGCGGVGNATFQMWLFESGGTSNQGVIQFVYGAMPASAVVDGGASVGLQSGGATNFASVTLSADTVNYAVANNTNIFAIPAGKSYLFTPIVPFAPTGLTFTGVTQTSLTLNWTDNAANEAGYAIYRSTDGVNFSFVTQTAANAVSFADTGLVPGTNYFYRVFAVSEGALSTALDGSQITLPPGNDTCNGAGGNWSSPASWSDGSVPTATDNVTIGPGCTITINAASNALGVTVQNGAILEFEQTTARTLTVALGVSVDNGGTLRSNTAGTVTTHQLVVGTDLVNNGTLDFSTNGNTAGAELRFTGTSNNAFSGIGGTTDLRLLTVQKGTGTITATSPTIEVSLSNMTVQGLSVAAPGFLNTATFNGIVKFSGTNVFSGILFQTAAYSIPNTAGVWLNNPSFTVTGQNGSPILSGLLRMTQGTLNIGTASGNSMGFATGSIVNIEGGTVNAAGRFGVSSSANAVTYSQSGGTVTVQTVGNSSTTLAGFDLGTSLSSVVSINGGTIVVQLANTAASGPRDYRNQASSGIAGVTGGTLRLGNASSGAAKLFTIRGVVPNLVIDNTSAAHSGRYDTTLTNYNNISLDVTVSPGTTFDAANVPYLFNGTTFTNNGTLTHNGASSNFVIFRTGTTVTYTGSGNVTVPMTNLAVQADGGSFTIDPGTAGITANAVRLFSGSIVNANELTIGSGGATTAVVQVGNTTTGTNAGTFDSTPTFNPGTGGISFSYLRTGASRTTGPELPATRSISNLTCDDNAAGRTLTLAGGNLTVTGTLSLTNGIIVTDNSNVLTHNGTATRTNGFVAGPLARSYTAVGTYTYHVGDNSGTAEYSPLTATLSALATNPSTLSVAVVDDFFINGMSTGQSASRYWDVAENGDLTATLDMTYIDPADVNGNEALYQVLRREAGSTAVFAGGTVNATTNTATAPNVTDFSQWGAGNLAPVAATASIEGRVVTSDGRGIRNAVIEITGGSLENPVRVVTGSFGSFAVEGLQVGQTYVATVRSKRFSFAVQNRVILLDDDVAGLVFIAEPFD